MNKDEEVRVATAFARQNGRVTQGYQVSVQNKAGAAYVLFSNPVGPPGDHFTVVIDTTKGLATDLIPGR